MDQFTNTPFDNTTFSPPQQQPTAGVFGRAVARYMLWSGKSMLIIGGGLVLGSIFLPPDYSPAHRIAVMTGMMESDETKAATAAKAEQVRLLAQRQAEAQARVQALKESMSGEIVVGEISDLACALSSLFGQGYNTQYQGLRDGLRSGCGVSGIVRNHMMGEFNRNLDEEVH